MKKWKKRYSKPPFEIILFQFYYIRNILIPAGFPTVSKLETIAADVENTIERKEVCFPFWNRPLFMV
jgi:hypothetical protein